MDITVSGRHLPVSEDLKGYAEGKLANLLIFQDHRQTPFETFLGLQPRDICMLVHRGFLVYGDERFRNVCSLDFSQFSEILVDGRPKLIWGKPMQLLERVHHKLGESLAFPFLPLSEA